jgi:hypothetical protein
METSTKEDFWAELDRIGPDEVRARLAIKDYSDLTEKGPLAREWLRRMDQTAADEPERSNLEQIRIARSAKNAAWAAAIMAAIAAIAAIISVTFTFLKKSSLPSQCPSPQANNFMLPPPYGSSPPPPGSDATGTPVLRFSCEADRAPRRPC